MICLALSLVVAAPFPVDVKLAEPTTTDTSFELAITRGILAVQNAKIVKQPNGDVLYFVSNGTGAESDRDLPTGPIAHLRTRELPRGYAIVLTPRSETTVTLRGAMIVATAKSTVVAPAPAEIKRVDPPSADVRDPVTARRATSVDDRAPTADEGVTVAENRSAKADGSKPSAQPIDDRNHSPMRNFGLLAGLLGVGAAVVIYGKKTTKKSASGDTAGIDLIAVKALGAKQRLAVVDACGDRLLIATSEQGVQLLSKLEGGTGVHKLPADFVATLAQAESASPVPTAQVTPVNTSKDLAGLVQLRARRATWTSPDALV